MMSVDARLTALERRWRPPCPDCPPVEIVGEGEWLRRRRDGAPTHCRACGQPVGVFLFQSCPRQGVRWAIRRWDQ